MRVRPRLALAGIAAAVCAALIGCATSLKTDIGWDQKVDFSKYHTWAWRADGSIEDATWARRCQDVLSDQLASNGLRQVSLDQNPDLWGVVHARLSEKTVVTAFSPDWGYAWGAWAPVEDYEQQIPVGTIIIDLVDVKMKRAVWQGKAKDAIDPGKSNEAREEALIGILKQLFAGFPPAAGAAPQKSASR